MYLSYKNGFRLKKLLIVVEVLRFVRVNFKLECIVRIEPNKYDALFEHCLPHKVTNNPVIHPALLRRSMSPSLPERSIGIP